MKKSMHVVTPLPAVTNKAAGFSIQVLNRQGALIPDGKHATEDNHLLFSISQNSAKDFCRPLNVKVTRYTSCNDQFEYIAGARGKLILPQGAQVESVELRSNRRRKKADELRHGRRVDVVISYAQNGQRQEAVLRHDWESTVHNCPKTAAI